MTYFHRRTSTIIGAKAFHVPVRDGKEWDHLAMVVKRNRVSGAGGVPAWGTALGPHDQSGKKHRRIGRQASYCVVVIMVSSGSTGRDGVACSGAEHVFDFHLFERYLNA